MKTSDLKVVILLATKEGEEFLPDQLASFGDQTYTNWDLIVSDDNSLDRTSELIRQFSLRQFQHVTMRKGPCQGFWQNFLSLVRYEHLDGDLFAYSDQDDIWSPNKLANAVEFFSTVSSSVPALYFTRTDLIDLHGDHLGFSPSFERPGSFRNALVQNIGGGNTMVFNKAAKDLLRSCPEGIPIVSHDWWTYQVIAGAGGVTHYDPRPSLKYRQHSANLVGSNIGARARLNRIAALLNGRVVGWNDTNIRSLNSIRSKLTTDNLIVLDRFSKARTLPLPKRLVLLWRSGVYRQSLVENIGLFFGAMIGRI